MLGCSFIVSLSGMIRYPSFRGTAEQRQLVEIAAALSLGARFVILDEPTAQLEARAIARLFDKLRALREQGVTFLFISHHLPEIYEICQRVTVFRDARHVITAPVAELNHERLVDARVGRVRGPEILVEQAIERAYRQLAVAARIPGESQARR